MFLQEAVYHQLRPGIPHDEPAERYILPGMMNAIGETPQVINDIAHQIVVRMLSAVKGVYLCFQNVQQLGEFGMLVMPAREWVNHGALLFLRHVGATIRNRVSVAR